MPFPMNLTADQLEALDRAKASYDASPRRTDDWALYLLKADHIRSPRFGAHTREA